MAEAYSRQVRNKARSSKKEAVQNFLAGVRGDFGSVQRYRAKYHAQKVTLAKLPHALITKVGFQTMTAIRLMQLAHQLRLPLIPQVASRAIRHLYGSEIHWEAHIEPGVSIVHGVGLVISHAASVGEGCILFHNVTLGEGTDPVTRQVGSPTLGSNVHIGPGSTLLGPIHVGDGTKIMAGSVLTTSTPANAIVRPAESVVTSRQGKK